MKTYKASFLVLLPLISVSLAGCNEKVIHEHTYSSDWSFNNTSHWHSATCEHSDLKSNEGDHVDNNHDNKCDICGFDISIPPTPVTEDYKVNAQEWEAAFGKNKPFGIADNYKFTYVENAYNQTYTTIFEVDGNRAKITTTDGSHSSVAYYSYESNTYYAFYQDDGVWLKQQSTSPKDSLISGMLEYYQDSSLFTFDEQNNFYVRPSFVDHDITYKDLYIKFQDKKIKSYGLKGDFYSNGSKMTGSIDGTIEYGNQIVALPPIPEHVHTYSTVWNADSTGHWHDATCGHDVIKDFAKHYDSNADGYCDVCSYVVGGMSNQVSETTWNSIMNGVEPFYLFNNASIMFAQKFNNNVVESFNISLAGNLAREDSANYTNSKFYQYDNNEDSYYKLEYNPTNGYERKSADWKSSDMGNLYFMSQILSSLNYSDFSFDSAKGKYCANHKIRIIGQDFDEFEIMFAYNSLVSAVGTVYYSATDNIYFTLDVMYGGVNIVLPPYKDITKHEYEYWSCFRSAYTSILDSIVSKGSENATDDHNTVEIYHLSTGSYDKIKSRMMSAIVDCSYPSLVNGTPDQFIEYLGADILLPLDDFVASHDKRYGTEILNDYFPSYMAENSYLGVDEYGQPTLSSIPFCRSTELMGYNGVFVDYCASLQAYSSYKLDEVPSTWQEWEIKGPIYREILDSLIGRGVYGRQDYEGTASDFVVKYRDGLTDSEGRKLLLDFTDVDINLTRVISWDSTDNMFITLIKQWGAEYTRLTSEQKQVEPLYRKGDVMFCSSENKPKVIECLKFFNRLSKQRIFGVPTEFQQSYVSAAFENNQVMFMLCSSGGLSYNTANWEKRFRVHALPYYDDGTNVRKYVMSQGADIALTDQLKENEKAFDFITELTTGDLNAEWCLQTGYYPVSKSALNSPKYQNFLKEATPEGINAYMSETGCSKAEAEAHAYEIAPRVAYREGSIVNNSIYMVPENNWIQFVDPAFIGSAKVRQLSKAIFEQVFIELAADAPDSDYDSILKKIIDDPDIKARSNINVVL